MKLCAFDGCGVKSHARGWCKVHYARWRRHGNPAGGGPQVGYRHPSPGKEAIAEPKPGTMSALQGFIAARNKRLAKLNQKAANQ